MADERAIQEFLDRAAPLILDHRVLSPQRLREIVQLSRSMGLTDQQLREELHDMHRRGVLAGDLHQWDRVILEQATDGPASERQAAGNESARQDPAARQKASTGRHPKGRPAAAPSAPPDDEGRPSSEPGRSKKGKAPGRGEPAKEDGSRVAPTSRASAPTPPRNAEATPRTAPLPVAQPIFEEVPESAAPVLPVAQPIEPSATPVPASPKDDEDPRATFRRRALGVIAEQGGLNSRTTALLESLAREHRLPVEEVQRLLAELAAPAPPRPADNDHPSSEAKPAPPRGDGPKQAPREAFRGWIEALLERRPVRLILIEDENRLVAEGSKRFRLSPVFARHVLEDVARENGVQLESQAREAAHAEPGDERFHDFFQRVAPILSMHRGVNARSRILMAAVAEEIGLSEEQLEAAIASLTRTQESAASERQEQCAESFRAYLRRQFAKVPHGIVTFRLRERFAQAGEQCHGLPTESIPAIIQEVAAERGLRLVSEEEASQHVERLIRERLGNKTRLEGEARKRIYSEGTQWDLPPMHVESLIASVQEDIRREHASHARRLRWMWMAVGLAACLGVVAIVGIAARDYLEQRRPEPRPETAGVAEAPAETDRSWWDAELSIAIVNVRTEFPDLFPLLESISSPRASRRSSTYRELVAAILDESMDTVEWVVMRDMLQGLFALDPEPSSARALVDPVLLPIDGPSGSLPVPDPGLINLYELIDALTGALERPGISDERRQLLAESLSEGLETNLSPSQDAAAFRRDALAALSRLLYRRMTALAATDADGAGEMFTVVGTLGARSLDAAELEKLDVEFVVAMLPGIGSDWRVYDGLIQQSVFSDDPFVVLKMLDYFERTSDSTLKGRLAFLFVERLGDRPGDPSPDAIADAVRDSLGVDPDPTGVERQAFLAARIRELQSQPPSAMSPVESLNGAARAAWTATLATALAQGPRGFPMFDGLREVGPPELVSPVVGPPPSPARIDDGALRARIHGMVEQMAGVSGPRVVVLRAIVSQGDRLSDVDPESGAAIAAYLLAPKGEFEHLDMMPLVAELARWPQVRLGLADRLSLDDIGDPDVQEVLEAVLDARGDVLRDVPAVRRLLLQSVATSLSRRPVPEGSIFDEARERLGAYYLQQASLAQIPIDETVEFVGPSDVLRELLRARVAEMERAGLSDDDRAFLDRLPHEVTAIEFATGHDAQETVLLQRLWLRVLALDAAGQRPERAPLAHEILAEVEQQDAGARHSLEQLYAGQIAEARLWQLRLPDPETDPRP